MRKIRIGNDARIRWEIEIDGEAQDLSQYELRLVLTKPHGEKQELAFTTQGNTIIAEYLGIHQECPGKYTLTCCARKDGHQAIIDACNAFELVGRSCEADEGTHPVVDIEVVDIKGNLEFGIPEAPLDGLIYGRQDGKWTNVSRGSYTRIEKVCDYLHEIWYQGVDYGYADLLPHTPLGACTSIRKGKFFARNLDWQYSECCEFFIHTPAVNGRHAVDGFGGNIPALTKEVVESGEWNAAYNWLPLSIADGHNDAGLCASMNVVPTKTAPNTYERTTGTNPGKPTLNGLMIVRFILDNYTDALHAAKDIRDNWNVVMPHTDTFDEELHFLIADKNTTIVLEFVGNEAKIIRRPGREGYITNFRLNGVNEESVSTLYNTIEPFGQGVERYGIISSAIVTPTDIWEAIGFISQLWYTHAYNDNATYNWVTEFAGLHDDLTVQAAWETRHVYDATLAAAHQAYLNRTRDGQTWQTTHSVVYDIESGECFFLVQQDWDTLTRRDIVLPIDAYTKAETDALLDGKEDKIFVAEYGVTNFAEITAAYNAGKKIWAKRSMLYFALTYINAREITFTTITHNDGDIAMEGVRVNDDDLWFQDFTFLAPESALATKVDKVTGKGLSTNDYTDADKAIVDGVTTALAGKQDTISDLSDIRSGASAGATAVQPNDLPTFGNIVTHDADEFLSSSTDYIKDAAVSQDGNTLTLTKKDNTQVTFAPSGGGGGADPEAVHFTPQTLTEAQKSQARANIGASGIPEELIGLMCTSETLYKGKLTSGKYFASKTKPSLEDIAELYSFPKSLTNFNGLLNGASNCTKVFAKSWDVSSVGTMFSAFAECSSLVEIDASEWDTSLVNNMQYTFSKCTSLVNVKSAKWNTSAVTHFFGAFNLCSSLVEIDASEWDLSGATSVTNFFYKCSSLVSIIGNHTLQEVIDGLAAFSGLSVGLDLKDTILERASLRAVINGLADLTGQTSQTLTLGTTLQAKLTAEDIQIATDKNWVIA